MAGPDQREGAVRARRRAITAPRTFAEQLAGNGVEAGKLAAADRTDPEVAKAWIPGVEIFARTIYPQRHRGLFGEFVRRDEGVLAEIGLWPQAMVGRADVRPDRERFSHSSAEHSRRDERRTNGSGGSLSTSRRIIRCGRYDEEQWDVMFFVQGVAEMILRDVRAGLPARTMRFFIDGDNHRGPNNVGGGHSARRGARDSGRRFGGVIMVYGTSTSFRPEFEGRIASEVETAPLPESWQKFPEANRFRSDLR